MRGSMHEWAVRIETWPLHDGNEADLKAVGERIKTFNVRADTLEDALYLGKLICKGIRHNPRVWQANIRSIVQQDA